MKHVLLVLFVLLSQNETQADPPKLPRKVGMPVAPAPAVPPTSDLVDTLNSGEWFIIENPTALVIKTIPAGIVEVKTRKAGYYNGHFAGGISFDEEREFTQPFVYQVKATGKGMVTLVIVPVTVSSPDDVLTHVLNVNGAQPPPIVVPPPTGTYYFTIVRPDGPASAEFTRIMGDFGWSTLQAKGHTYRDVTLTEARNNLKLDIPAGTPLPCVVTLQTAPNTPSKVVRGPIQLPTTSDAIMKLPEGIR